MAAAPDAPTNHACTSRIGPDALRDTPAPNGKRHLGWAARKISDVEGEGFAELEPIGDQEGDESVEARVQRHGDLAVVVDGAHGQRNGGARVAGGGLRSHDVEHWVGERCVAVERELVER